MADDIRQRRQLRARIQDRIADIDEFLVRARPRRNLLTNISIVCSSLAAVLAAGPAVGGPDAMAAVASSLSLGGPSAVWRPLCIGAFVVALAAAITANLQRSYDLPAHIAAAETCRAALESLLATIDFEDTPVGEAVDEYQECLLRVPFVPERSRVPAGARR